MSPFPTIALQVISGTEPKKIKGNSYSCKFCDFTYTRSSSLSIHMKTSHLSVYDFKHMFCECQTSDLKQLLRPKESVHGRWEARCEFAICQNVNKRRRRRRRQSNAGMGSFIKSIDSLYQNSLHYYFLDIKYIFTLLI